MPLITRASLPENFFDITSSMLLPQPEPQYVHCELWKSALSASLGGLAAFGIPGRQFVGVGADPGMFEQERLRLADPISSAAVMVVAELGKGPGHTVKVNRPYFANSTYTLASRTVASGSTISTTPINISMEQVAVTLLRLAGPYSSSVQPLGVDRFDTGMGVHKLAALVGGHLKRDFDRFVDAVMVSLLDGGSTALYPTGMSAVDDALVANAFNMDYDLVVRVEQAMDEDDIPVFPNGRRVLMVTPKQAAGLKLDPMFQRLVRTFPQVNPVLASSYIGSVGKFDVFVSNTLTQTNNSSSVPIQYGQAFGPGVVLSGVGDMPRVAFSTNDNYGEHSLVLWMMYAGFSLSDNRFVVSVRST